MKRILLLGGFLLFSSFVTWGQTQQTGLPQFGSVESSNFDFVNHQNLDTGFSIPIFSKPGRGIAASSSISYNSLFWSRVSNGVTTSWTPNGSFGWNYSPFTGGSSWTATTDSDCGVGTRETIWTNYSYSEENGTVHQFPNIWITTCASSGSVFTGYAADASGFWMDASNKLSPIVYSPAGVKRTQDRTVTDSNGNFTTVTFPVSGETDLTDSTGAVALKAIALAGETDYQFQDTSGTWQSVKVKTQSYSIKSAFGCSTVEYTGTAALPYEIDLPNGQKYTVTYEPTPNNTGYYTGRIS
jgi:hypothetical protein